MQVLERTLKVNEAVVYAELDEEAVLLNVETGVYYGLDDVGARIWKLLEPGATEERIVTVLFDEYEVDPDELNVHVRDFLALLEREELIGSVDEGANASPA